MRRSFTILALLFAWHAEAEDEVQSALFSAVTIASEHRFNGLSLTDRNPALQLSLHWWRSDGRYAGIWMTNVDYLDAHNTTLEVDTYLGRNFEAGVYRLKAEAMYSWYNDHEAGPRYDFFQAKLEASRRLGKTTAMTGINWSPSGSYGAGRTVQVRGGLSYALTTWLDVEASGGRGLYARSNERNYWEAGFSARWGKVRLDLFYMGMETDLPLCSFVDWCEPGVVGRITLASYD